MNAFATSPHALAVALPIALAAAVLLGAAAWRADWRRFADGREAHLFWCFVTSIALLWHFDAWPRSERGGVHLLGAMVGCALFGLRIGLVALAAGIGLQHAADGIAWTAFAPAWLVGAAMPAALARLALGIAGRAGDHLGRMPLVAASFVGGGASMVCAAALQGWLGLVAIPGVPYDAVTAVALVALMTVAEAQLSASVLAVVVVQRPQWLAPEPVHAPRRRV